MAEQGKSSSYQSLGNGVYRVGGAVHVSAVTGLYVTKSSRKSGSDATKNTRAVSPSTSK